MKEYEWDIAVSLCQEEVGFTKQLIAALNPKLNIFFYEDRQDMLVGQNGIDAFVQAFGEKARMVVIIGSKNWGKTQYTELERDTIHDRQRDVGNNFISVVRLDDEFNMPWYPKSRIYADARKYPVKEIAHFIEYQYSQLGGEVTPLTLKEKIEGFKLHEEQHRVHLKHIQSPNSRSILDEVLPRTQRLINENIANFKEYSFLPDGTDHKVFPEGHIGIDNIGTQITAEIFVNGLYGLRFNFRPSKQKDQINTALFIELGISRMVSQGHPERQKLWAGANDITWYAANDAGKKLGWSEKTYVKAPNLLAPPGHYIVDFNGTYSLGVVQTAEELVNSHFHWIADNLDKAYKNIFG